MSTRKALCLVALAFGALAQAQEPTGPAAPGRMPVDLQQMIAMAMRSNPEVVLAESKLRQVQAEVNQIRLKVTREVIGIYNERQKLEHMQQQTRERLGMTEKLHQKGQASHTELGEAMVAIARVDAEIAQVEADKRYLLGVGGAALDRPVALSTQQVERPPPPTKRTRPPMAEAMRNTLEQPVKVEFNEIPFDAALKALHSELFVLDRRLNEYFSADELVMTLSLPKTTLGAALQAITDQYPVCFIIRDYGILVAHEECGAEIPGAAIPPSLPLVH